MKIKIWRKAVLGLFGAICILGMNAMSVKAETYTCESGGVKYTSVLDAIEAVPENQAASIKMISDETLSCHIPVYKREITLDLAGHRIEYPDSGWGYGITVEYNGKLTLNDSVGTGTISMGNVANGMVFVKGGNFIMNGGSIVHHENGGSSECGIKMTWGEATINGGTIDTVFPIEAYHLNSETKLTITGGTIIGQNQAVLGDGVEADIQGGSFTATATKSALYIFIAQHRYTGKVTDITISGGDFHGQKTGIIVNSSVTPVRTPGSLLAEDCVWSDPTEIKEYDNVYWTANNIEVYKQVTDTNVTITGIKDEPYIGTAITQNFTVAYKGKTLQEGKDYTVSYANNVNVGTATVTITFEKPYIGTLKKTFNITKNNSKTQESGVKRGSAITTKTAVYKITKIGTNTGTVEYVRPTSKKAKSASIPATIKAEGVTYKVTSIAKNAFKNNKKITKVTIGKNVSKIGKQAFYGCKNLKNITIKTTKLTKKSMGAKAFKGTPKSAKVKVPKSKYKAYKKLLVSKGISKKAKFTK